MPPTNADPLGAQLQDAITVILRKARRDPRQAIRLARSYLAWVRRFKPVDTLAEEQRFAAIATLRKLIAMLESRLPPPRKKP
jgi:hypothetical protein